MERMLEVFKRESAENIKKREEQAAYNESRNLSP
jgi:hypothetical protein